MPILLVEASGKEIKRGLAENWVVKFHSQFTVASFDYLIKNRQDWANMILPPGSVCAILGPKSHSIFRF